MKDYSLDDLLRMGVYEISGVDEDGSPLYSLNLEVAKKKAPEIYEEDRDLCLTALLDAVEDGYLELEVDSVTMEWYFVVTEKGELLPE